MSEKKQIYRCKGYREDLKNVGCEGCIVSIPKHEDLSELNQEIIIEIPNNCVYYWGKRRPTWERIL